VITAAKRKVQRHDIANAVLSECMICRRDVPNDVTVTTTGITVRPARINRTSYRTLTAGYLSVTLLVALFLGCANPVWCCWLFRSHSALTMTVFYLLGYTINRVTLFALILLSAFSSMTPSLSSRIWCATSAPENHGRSMSEVAVEAVARWYPPFCHFAVSRRYWPMAFVRA